MTRSCVLCGCDVPAGARYVRGACARCYSRAHYMRLLDALRPAQHATRPPRPDLREVRATLAAGRSTLRRQARRMGMTPAALKEALYG